MSIEVERQRRVTFVDDISPITADILNDLQAVTFDTFSNLHLKVESDKLHLAIYGMETGGHYKDLSALVVDGKIRFVDPSNTEAAKDGIGPEPTTGVHHSVVMDVGNDTGVYTNSNSNLDTVVFGSTFDYNSGTQRVVAKYYTDSNGKFMNTEMIAGAVARSHQYNAFTFESIDGNSTPLSIMGKNNRHPNLFVQSFTSFTRPPIDPDNGYNPSNPSHENWYEVADAHGGIQTSHIYADNPEDVIVLQDNVHVVGSLTVGDDIIFDQTQLGELGASPWNKLDSAAAVQEFADSTFGGLLPNPSHAPVNFFPLGTVIDWAITSDFDIFRPETWPIGWVPATVDLTYDMDDDCTRAWLSPLFAHFNGSNAVPSGGWQIPGSLPYAKTDVEPFIFLGSMSYLVEDSATGDLVIDEHMQGYGHKFSSIVVS